MDSLSQIALGSAIAMTVMGRRTAAWKAALWGGVAGTLPDLDALIDHGDAILNMVLHRAETHSLLFLTLLSLPLAWVVTRLSGDRAGGSQAAAPDSSAKREDTWGYSPFLRWWLALWLVLFTHPLLDTMTIYGTQLMQPFSDYPYGVGSMFIIDPAYTLPLLLGIGIALVGRGSARSLRWNTACLALSTAYLGWSVWAQQQALDMARASLAQEGIVAERLLATPTPFNTLLWRLVAVTPTHHHEANWSLLDSGPPQRWSAHPRGAELIAQHAQAEPVRRMADFTHGFYRLAATPEGQLRVTDLRMGQEPDYVFNFDVGPLDAVGSVPAVQVSQRPDIGPALRWIWQRMWGQDVPPPWPGAN